MKREIETYINEAMKIYDLPGLSLNIVKGGQSFISSGFGIMNIKTKKAVSETSLFHMASISKPFTATAVMQLAERGKLGLNDTVVKHLPYFKLGDDRYVDITVQQMLCHYSGIPDETDYQWQNPEYDEEALERYVRSCGDLKLAAPPGKRFLYSNIAYEILGDLIAKVSGFSFEQYISDNILEPLNMTHSTFLKKDIPVASLSSPHVRLLDICVPPVYPYNRSHAPSSTLHSSAREISRWVRANLNLGELDGTRILKTSGYDKLWNEHGPTGKDKRFFASAGLSWFIGSHRGYKTICHSGHDLGFSTFLVMVPEKELSVTVLCNLYPAPAVKIGISLLDIMIGEIPEADKTPVVIPLLKTYIDGGIEATIREFHLLENTKSDVYDFSTESILKTGEMLIEAGRIENAVDIINLGAAAESGNPKVYELLARAFFHAGDMEKASLNARKSLTLEPNNPSLSFRMKHFNQGSE